MGFFSTVSLINYNSNSTPLLNKPHNVISHVCSTNGVRCVMHQIVVLEVKGLNVKGSNTNAFIAENMTLSQMVNLLYICSLADLL